MDINEYWIEAVRSSFEENGVKPETDNIILLVADDMKIASDQIGMAFGHECIPNPLETENKRLKSELQKEQDKMVCEKCNGKGSFRVQVGSSHWTDDDCHNCNGTGYIYR